jgi:hypothetical protein
VLDPGLMRHSRRLLVGVMIAVAAAFGWWQTGLHPFSTDAYLSLIVPVMLAAFLAVKPWRQPAVGGRHAAVPGKSHDMFPLLVIVGLGIGLETAGLILGGRSVDVPTLSTVFDRAMRWHTSRWLLATTWILVGFLPLVWRRRRFTPGLD